MEKHAKWARILVCALLALLSAGSALATLAAATGLAIPFAKLYLGAALGAAVCALWAYTRIGALGALAVAAGVWAHVNKGDFRALRALVTLLNEGQAAQSQVMTGARLLMEGGSFLLAAMLFALIIQEELSSLAVMIVMAVLVGSHAMSATASIPASLPGLAACAAVFALTSGIPRDRAMLRVLIPSALCVALAAMLIPAGRHTWPPLESAAERVRILFEEYFNFTRQRIAFSINEQGYDHAGETDDGVVAMLGGPAHPHDGAVMRVRADGELLLRGTVRTTYTGYSWVDTVPRSRYLYFDLTRRGVRDRTFNLDGDSDPAAFETRTADIEFLSKGTSTLFVPVRLTSFEMPLSTAVYYNTAGEVFLAREVEPNDRYSVTAQVPVQGDALRDMAFRGELSDDPQWASVSDEYTRVDEGIDPQVYDLAWEIVGDAATAYERANALCGYLSSHMRYRLDVEYPPVGRDFVSHFLLDTKEGYCSYFATAMAVLGRIVGLPTRYAEGYLARPGLDGAVTLTGADAHAWAEVYFRGVGWVPFDATAGASGRGGGHRPGSGADSQVDATPSPAPTEAPGSDEALPDEGASPTPTPDDFPPDGEATPAPTEPPEAGLTRDNTPTPPPADAPDELPPDAEDGGDRPDSPRQPNRGRLALIIAIILALIALMALWARHQLRAADPLTLCQRVKGSDRRAMILYRGCLTALNHMGQQPMSGETPQAFADRVSAQLDVPEFAAFVQVVTLHRYGSQKLKKADIDVGRRAWERLTKAMRLRERVRLTLTRIIRGLGDFENIP